MFVIELWYKDGLRVFLGVRRQQGGEGGEQVRCAEFGERVVEYAVELGMELLEF